ALVDPARLAVRGDPRRVGPAIVLPLLRDLALVQRLRLAAFDDAPALLGREHLEHHLRGAHDLRLAQVRESGEPARSGGWSGEVVKPQRERVALVAGAGRR